MVGPARRSVGLVAILAATCALSACGTLGTPTKGVGSAQITVGISLQQSRVTAGSTIRGVATLINHTARTATVETCARDGWLDVGLSSDSIRFQPVSIDVACRPTVRLAPGRTRFPITISRIAHRVAALAPRSGPSHGAVRQACSPCRPGATRRAR